MRLITWEPFNEIDQFFDDRLFPASAAFPKIGLDLAIDVYEENGHVVAKMCLPGVKSEELDISLEDDVLTIAGKREEEKEVEKKNYFSKEIRRGSFSRTVSLPKSVDAGKSVAKYVNGELAITMPVIAGTAEKATKIKIAQ